MSECEIILLWLRKCQNERSCCCDWESVRMWNHVVTKCQNVWNHVVMIDKVSEWEILLWLRSVKMRDPVLIDKVSECEIMLTQSVSVWNHVVMIDKVSVWNLVATKCQNVKSYCYDWQSVRMWNHVAMIDKVSECEIMLLWLTKCKPWCLLAHIVYQMSMVFTDWQCLSDEHGVYWLTMFIRWDDVYWLNVYQIGVVFISLP